MTEPKKGFLARYKRWIIAFFVLWAVLLGVLIMSGGGGDLPFQYQVF